MKPNLTICLVMLGVWAVLGLVAVAIGQFVGFVFEILTR